MDDFSSALLIILHFEFTPLFWPGISSAHIGLTDICPFNYTYVVYASVSFNPTLCLITLSHSFNYHPTESKKEFTTSLYNLNFNRGNLLVFLAWFYYYSFVPSSSFCILSFCWRSALFVYISYFGPRSMLGEENPLLSRL